MKNKLMGCFSMHLDGLRINSIIHSDDVSVVI